MPSLLVSLEVVVGVLVGVTLSGLAAIFLRRRTIARGTALTVCAVRDPGPQRWRLGLMRFGPDRLEWFPLGGLSLRPRYRWDRYDLDLDVPVWLSGRESIDVLPEALSVPCRCGVHHFDLALPPSAYTALRSWLEAAPPGYNVNVA